MEIVYCGGCGKVLLKDDFNRGGARFLDNRPWCAECKPPDKQQISSGAHSTASIKKTGSSSKHPRIKVETSRRESAPEGPNKAVVIGAVILVAALALMALVMRSDPAAPTPLPPPADRVVKTPVSPPPATNDEAPRLLKELESLASLAPADRILARCDEIRSKLRGTPQEKRFLEIETAARDQKKLRDQETQVGRDLETLAKLIDEDPRFQRADEVLRRFKSLQTSAGPRAAELDRRLADYEKARRESPHEKHAGPFDADDQGFIRNWLVLGPFPNDKDQGMDTDFLKPEAGHDPVAGLSVGKPTWAAFSSAEAKIDFFKVPHLGIKAPKDYIVVYAACLVQVPVDVAAEFRLGSDDGGALWVDGRLLGKVHRPRSLKLDEDRHAVPLVPGLHRVLVKVDQHSRNYEFALRIVGPDGLRVPRLRIWN